MTHFTVGIVVPADEMPRIESFIEEQMESFDENAQVEPHVCYSVEQAKSDIDRDVKRLERIIARQDPDYDLVKCREILAKLHRTTPEEKYRAYVADHEGFNDRGEPISTCNPKSKWDWYRIGGRWDGWITGNERESDGGFNFGVQHETVAHNIATTEQALERDKIPHAIVTPDGEWHERGEMWWFGIMLTESDGWDVEAKAILAKYPGHRIVILDAHI